MVGHISLSLDSWFELAHAPFSHPVGLGHIPSPLPGQVGQATPLPPAKLSHVPSPTWGWITAGPCPFSHGARLGPSEAPFPHMVGLGPGCLPPLPNVHLAGAPLVPPWVPDLVYWTDTPCGGTAHCPSGLSGKKVTQLCLTQQYAESPSSEPLTSVTVPICYSDKSYKILHQSKFLSSNIAYKLYPTPIPSLMQQKQGSEGLRKLF